MITFLYIVGGVIGVIVGLLVLMVLLGKYLNSRERKNAEKNYDKANKEYLNKNFPEALFLLARAFYVPLDENYSKQDASTALRAIILLETILEELGVNYTFTTDLKNSLDSASFSGGIVSKEITDPVEDFLGKFKFSEVDTDIITMAINQISVKGEKKDGEISDGFDLGFTKKVYSYRIQGEAIFLIIFCIIAAFVAFLYLTDITIIDMFQDEKNSLQLSIVGFMVILTIFFIKIYKITRKLNHKFVITEEGITFPPKLIFKKIITISFDQIKSVRTFSNRSLKTIFIKTEVGDFAFPEARFENKKKYIEVYDSIEGSIAKDIKQA